VIACLPDGTCVTNDGDLLAGFRPAVWPDLRLVDDDPVIESDVQVQATAFGRIIAREGFNAETFASTEGKPVVVTSVGPTTSIRVPDPLNGAWALNNFNGSEAFWITYEVEGQPVTSPANGTAMTVTEAFTVPVGTTGSLEGFVLADDTAQVVLLEDSDAFSPPIYAFNNTPDSACAAGPIGCQPTEPGDLSMGDAAWQSAHPGLLSALPPGDYSLEITARQDGGGPFGLQYAFDVILDPLTVADFCWTFDGGTPGEKECVSVAECDDCASPPDQCPVDGVANITLTAGPDGDAICEDIEEQFAEQGFIEPLQQFQFIVGLDVPATSQAGSVRVATCTIDGTEYVPLCRNPASKVVEATVNNDIPLFAVETPRCVKIGGKTIC
jgi:hypothetical protein